MVFVFMFLLILKNYMDHHMKKYTYAHVVSNIQKIRKKLDLKNGVDVLGIVNDGKKENNIEYTQYKYID
jgi:hypothetical protein